MIVFYIISWEDDTMIAVPFCAYFQSRLRYVTQIEHKNKISSLKNQQSIILLS